MVSFIFAHPHYLWFLILAPLFVFIHFFSLNYNKTKAMPFANFQAIERFYGIEFFSKNFIALYFQIIILILLVLGLAGMSISFNADTSSNSFVLAIDSSGSMTAQDLSPSRFDVAKEMSKDFVNSLPVGVNVGVIGFSGDALIYENLVNDKSLVKKAIDDVEIGKVEGTNIYNAVITANKLFTDKSDGRKKSIILMSDGQINVGDAPLIIDYATENNIVIHTIAIGTTTGGVTNLNVISKADVDFLKAISFETGGQFVTADDFSSFEDAYPTILEQMNLKVTLDLSAYILIAALILQLLYWISYSLKFKSFP